MEPIRLVRDRHLTSPAEAKPEVTDWDQQAYLEMVSVALTEEQRARVATPGEVYRKQRAVLGLHWHPEFVPLDVIRARVGRMFPGRERELIIPTQHNELLTYDGYAGVEIDCYSPEFNRKVQLLAHFAARRLEAADVLKAMLAHTFRYRASQLWQFIDSVLEPAHEARVQKAAAKTGATDELIQFVRVHVMKLRRLIDDNAGATPADMLKNKIIRNYFNTLRARYDDRLISHAQIFLQTIKNIVKREFRLDYFYRTQEVIEEVRGIGGCIVVPHPEQFWPILLAEYDADGIEVWNPQSREFTEFLIQVVDRENQTRRRKSRPVLVTMGDDTHFGEKVIHPEHQDPEKANRELGVQPAWDDLSIRKSLIIANMDRATVIQEYKSRLG